jgi:hypothetical protein
MCKPKVLLVQKDPPLTTYIRSHIARIWLPTNELHCPTMAVSTAPGCAPKRRLSLQGC